MKSSKRNEMMKTHRRWMEKPVALALSFLATSGSGGSLDAPAGPDSPASATFTLNDLYHKLDTRSNVVLRTGAFAEPSDGPTGGTMHTLNEIMGLATNRAAVPRTGQTASYRDGDDVWHALNGIGVTWPTNRYCVMSGPPDERTHCVLDTLTGLMWARDASNACGFATSTVNWTTAIDTCNNLTYGGYDDWRLPNVCELLSLMDLGNTRPAMTPGHPFSGVQSGVNVDSDYARYHTSSIYPNNTEYILQVCPWRGNVDYGGKTGMGWVWPVRGGGQ